MRTLSNLQNRVSYEYSVGDSMGSIAAARPSAGGNTHATLSIFPHLHNCC